MDISQHFVKVQRAMFQFDPNVQQSVTLEKLQSVWRMDFVHETDSYTNQYLSDSVCCVV